MPAPAAAAAAALVGAYRAYKAYKAYKKLKKAYDAAKKAKRFADAAKKAKQTADAAKKTKKAADAAKKAKNAFSKFKKGPVQKCPLKKIEALRRKAVREAWKKEHELVRRTGKGSRNWTRAEKQELLKTGKVKGYEGHHINNVKNNPNLAGDQRNIKFVKGRAEHLKEHGGNFRTPTKGPLIKR
jgi:hypothetical protein